MSEEAVAIRLRKPCGSCSSNDGHYVIKSGQSVVYCECGKYQGYNAPKTETGLKARSVSTTHSSIKPKLRARILERANRRCELCGKPADKSTTGLHVGHVLSVKTAHESGLSDSEINSDENLIAECDECNLGHGKNALPLRLLVAILIARSKANGDEVAF